MNLMSVFFAIATLWLVYSLILRITASYLAALFGALTLAFVSVFWLQTVAAEVYVLHTFFMALLVKILWWWDERREFPMLILFVFATGISFGNHMQTVMLAPAVLFMILTGDKRTLSNLKNAMVLSFFFMAALSIYLYLPIRTEAGAAIHWGDPNTLDRFLAHVSGKSHRAGYVFTKSLMEYLLRTKETLLFVWSQFSVILLFSLWGWFRLGSFRWRIFFVLVIVFDFVYTIFLNIISLEITPFLLPTFIVLTLLTGVGIGDLLKKARAHPSVGAVPQRLIRVACFLIPATLMFMNYGRCNQSRNYTAYEQAVNIFRTMGPGDILFTDSDNNVFPVTYGRVVEKMRNDVKIYDRLNLIFKLPNLETQSRTTGQGWEDRRNNIEKQTIEKKGERDVYYALFIPNTIQMPIQYQLVPIGLVNKVVRVGETKKRDNSNQVWKYYSIESFYEDFSRDYMNREVTAFFHFNHAKHFFAMGHSPLALKYIKKASEVGFNDDLIHSEMAVFLVNEGFFKEARKELEKALVYHKDLDGIYNNWGYYYHKTGDYKNAITSFQKALELSPDNFGYHNNLGFSLYEAGDREEAHRILERSLRINEKQPEIVKFIENLI
jgi:tetratricopeptide (TPR) repeat protein